MPTEREEKRGGAGCAIVGVLMLLLGLPLYVLSIGPAAWIASRNPAMINAVEIFYFPLSLLARWFSPIRDFLEWYMELW